MARGKWLLLFILVMVHGVGLSQGNPLSTPCTLVWQNVPLAEALAAACEPARLQATYDPQILPDSSVSASFTERPLSEVLDFLLDPHGLTYSLKGNNLVVFRPAPKPNSPNSNLKTHVISGYVEDRETGERIAGASIYDLRTKRGAISNDAGFFSLRLPADSVKLVVSIVGYAVHAERLRLGQDLRRTIQMVPDIELKAVEILDSDQNPELDQLAGVDVVNVPLNEVELMPTLMGEPDVYNALKLYPGVHSGGDGSSGLYVRGGGPDQNLVLLDGVPIYNSSHLFGFYSIFNADAIKRIELVKGGFPARYGGRLSSIIGIDMKEGDVNQWHGEANLGLVAAKVFFEGPLIKEKTSLVFSARRTIMEPFFKVVNILETARNGNSVDYSFFDVNAKLTHRLSPRDQLFMTFYKGGDKFGSGYAIDTNNVSDRFDFDLQWGNTAGILRWRRDWGKYVFGDISVYTTQYRYEATSANQLQYLGLDTSTTELSIRSQVRDYGVRVQFDLIPGDHHYLRVGGSSILHNYQPETYTQIVRQSSDTTENLAGQRKILPIENNVFIEENLRIGKSIRLNLGLNMAYYLVDSTSQLSLQPRFSGRWSLPHGFAFEGNFTRMVQYVHLLTNAGVGLPTDLWVPATKRIAPQTAYQASIGMEKAFKNLNLELGIEAYGKELRNLIDYQTGINFLGVNDWENLVETGGEGRSYGLEFLLRKHTGRFTATLGYTLSRTTRRFETINFGKEFLYKYDRTHDIAAAAIFRATDRLSFSAEWIYGTGNAITFPESVRYAPTSSILGFWDLNEGPNLNVIIDYGDRNSFRIPSYHRLDVNATYTWKRSWGEWTLNAGIFNVYNRRNPYFLFLRADYSNDPTSPEIKARKMSLLPILPSINLGCKF